MHSGLLFLIDALTFISLVLSIEFAKLQNFLISLVILIHKYKSHVFPLSALYNTNLLDIKYIQQPFALKYF